MKFFYRIEYWLNLDKDKIHGIKVAFITLIGIGLIMFFMNQYWSHEKEERDEYLSLLDSTTTAVVDTIVIKKGISHGAEGSVVILNGFEVEYKFQVKNNVFVGKESFGENHFFWSIYDKIINLKKGDSIPIKYYSKKPKYNKLNIK